MAKSSIPVDLWNPGQVFACLGLLELSDTLLGDATAAFDWHRGEETTFLLSAHGDEPPVERAVRFLESASITTRAPHGSSHFEKWKSAWGELVEDRAGLPFPSPDPDSPATLPLILRDKEGNEATVEYWGDVTKRDNVKFWAGAGGYPGSAIMRDALQIVEGKMRQHANDPFALDGPQSSSFRFDWRRDYIPIEDGFSPNAHQAIHMVGYPLVEILAAIGVANARPSRKNKLEYRYGVLGYTDEHLLDPIFHRAALGAASTPVPGCAFRRFVMRLGWPGQEGQARCITQTFEEEIEP